VARLLNSRSPSALGGSIFVSGRPIWRRPGA